MEISKFQVTAGTELDRITWLSMQNPEMGFYSLMHHINVDSLRACYHKLNGKKAVGADGVTKDMYGINLEANLEELISKMKRMSYRPGAVREVRIRKEGKGGATRPLGISNFEDKLVQKRMQELLGAIYEPLFMEHSYGFRPNRSGHDAIKAVNHYLHRNKVETVIDVDLANYFGTIDHHLLMEFLQEKIKDTRFLRYIRRMFKAGILSAQELRISEEGVPQGSCVSPVLANIYAHYVIDNWFNKTVKSHLRGRAEMFRYADDMVILCEYARDATRILDALKQRLTKYKLMLNEEKTKLLRFSRQRYARGERQETFDFLGFTFYLGRSRAGPPVAKLQTSRKRATSKLKKLTTWLKENRNRYRMDELWKRICLSVRGHIQYYGVSFNMSGLQKFIRQVERIAFKWLNRRSQKRSFNWNKFNKFLKMKPLPKARIVHKLF